LWRHLSIVREAGDETREVPPGTLADLHSLCLEATAIPDADS
jgi:hypothetical protein